MPLLQVPQCESWVATVLHFRDTLLRTLNFKRRLRCCSCRTALMLYWQSLLRLAASSEPSRSPAITVSASKPILRAQWPVAVVVWIRYGQGAIGFVSESGWKPLWPAYWSWTFSEDDSWRGWMRCWTWMERPLTRGKEWRAPPRIAPQPPAGNRSVGTWEIPKEHNVPRNFNFDLLFEVEPCWWHLLNVSVTVASSGAQVAWPIQDAAVFTFQNFTHLFLQRYVSRLSWSAQLFWALAYNACWLRQYKIPSSGNLYGGVG